MSSPTPKNPTQPYRISQVAEETGMGKELIHHYIREGVLPKPERRAIYSDKQIRLLREIKKLREKHNLPLELIRKVFEIYDYDPDSLEPLTLIVSLSSRLQALAEEGDLSSPQTLGLEELAAETGVGVDRIEEYQEAKLIQPQGANGERRFTRYDANVVAFCERGRRLGVPFESFRAIGSYCRVAFDLEYEVFLRPQSNGDETTENDPKSLLRDLFIRREIAIGFVQNLLHAQAQSRISDLFERPGRPVSGLDEVIYRPSGAFLRRHGIGRRLEERRETVCRSPESLESWRALAETLLECGEIREAAFFLEEARRKWPKEESLRLLQAMARIRSGDFETGLEQTQRLIQNSKAPPLAKIYHALGLYARATKRRTSGDLAQAAAKIRALVEESLVGAERWGALADLDTRMLGGWLLTSLPPTMQASQRGVGLLREALDDLFADGEEAGSFRIESRKINAAYLLYECVTRRSASSEELLEETPADWAERLRVLICRLDPQSAFAEAAYLSEGAS